MSIKRVVLQNYLVFKGEIELNFCPGVNVLIGGNGNAVRVDRPTDKHFAVRLRRDDGVLPHRRLHHHRRPDVRDDGRVQFLPRGGAADPPHACIL